MKRLLAAFVALTILAGCVPLVIAGGAAVGLWIGSDPRKADVIKSDFEAGVQLSDRIIDTYKERAHVNVNIFNNVVLLTGEAPDEATRQQIEQFAWQMKRKPRDVYNEIVIAQPSTLKARALDSELSARVKATILANASDSTATHIMVVTERSVVYLLGVARRGIIDSAANSTSKVSGVKQVVKMVELEPNNPAETK